MIMKKLIFHALFLLVISATINSCTKDDANQFNPTTGAATHGITKKATVIRYPQEETFFNDCCGEEVTINYTVVLTSNANGYQASLNQLSGVGLTSGNIYHGANTQGLSDHDNNQSYHYS